MIHDAVAHHKRGQLSIESFKGFIKHKGQISGSAASRLRLEGISIDDLFGHFPSLKEAEDYLICESLKQACGNQRIAASLLGISRQALNQRIKKKCDN